MHAAAGRNRKNCIVKPWREICFMIRATVFQNISVCMPSILNTA